MTQAPIGDSGLFHTPPPPGQGFSASDHVGALVIICVHRFEAGVSTQFGIKNTVNASIFVVEGPFIGSEYPNVSLWNGQLVGQLMGLTGKVTLGRLAHGERKKAGQSPPVILADATPEDRAKAAQWHAAHPGRIEEAQRVGKILAEAPRQTQPVNTYGGNQGQWNGQPPNQQWQGGAQNTGQNYGQPGYPQTAPPPPPVTHHYQGADQPPF